MNKLNNKIDFALVFATTNANPNGDPLDGNRPRSDYRGLGEVSDVCLKRKIRNRLLDEGEAIFVQSDDRRADEYRSLRDRADANVELVNVSKLITQNKASRDDYAKCACQSWIDVRAFGQVFAFKNKKNDKNKDEDGDSSDAVSIGIRGPVTIQTAFSVDTVNVTTTQITKSVNLETGSDPDKKGSDTIGSKHRVDFALYKTFGSINVQTAEKTGFSEEDAEKIKYALQTLFENDDTSARPSGSMQVVKLVWWKHNNKSGQYSSAKVHQLLKVKLKEGKNNPLSIEDYDINVDKLDGLAYEEING